LRKSAHSPAFVVLCLGLLAGCSSAPQRIDEQARLLGFTRSVLQGGAFAHVVYRKAAHASGGSLHVYIEGDGNPYLQRGIVAADPTPRRPVMLQLMALDSEAAVYVGRPCYFGLATTAPCTTLDWTLNRFSQDAVDSMAQVIERLRAAGGHGTVELFGHSGGGAMAVLIARRLHDATRVVTLAGNLDIAAWTELHGYSPLLGSLNPVSEGPLPERVAQLHLAGELDRNVPPELIADAAHRLGAAGIRILAGVEHACCWEGEWPGVVAGHSLSPQ
jgi:hypothetical protein